MWLGSQDTLQIIPDINLYRKKRGAPGGPGLIDMDISDIKCTRRVASRVVGQMYDPSGCFLNILTGSFKILYSKVCQASEGWDDVPADEDLVVAFKDFLLTGRESVTTLKPWPRFVRGEGAGHLPEVHHTP